MYIIWMKQANGTETTDNEQYTKEVADQIMLIAALSREHVRKEKVE